MSKAIESNINEESNTAGDGSGLALPPAFVFVNTKKHRTYKKNNKVDGRTTGAKNLMSRINKRKMKEQVEEKPVVEAVATDTERAQKQIAQGKKLKRQKELQKKRKDAKSKMQDKTKEMETLVKARLSDFKKKATDQSKKLQKNEVEPTGDTIAEGQDVVQVALDVATSELDPASTVSYAKIQFADGGVQNLDNFSAKRIAATYAQLDDTHKQQFQYMLNKDAGTYQSALDFAIRNN